MDSFNLLHPSLIKIASSMHSKMGDLSFTFLAIYESNSKTLSRWISKILTLNSTLPSSSMSSMLTINKMLEKMSLMHSKITWFFISKKMKGWPSKKSKKVNGNYKWLLRIYQKIEK